MKNLKYLILSFMLAFGAVGSVFAVAPAHDNEQTGVIEGSTYVYSVPNISGLTWTWEVLDKDGNDAPGTSFTLEDVNVATPLGYTKKITWNVSETYFVRVVAKTVKSCTNEFVTKVDVAGNNYNVAFNAGTLKEYCSDDAALANGPEIVLDVLQGTDKPADEYYSMTVYYSLDGGVTEIPATITNTNTFNLGAIDLGADLVNPTKTSVTITLLRVVDSHGVEITPADADKEMIITINPIPAKPVITFN